MAMKSKRCVVRRCPRYAKPGERRCKRHQPKSVVDSILDPLIGGVVGGVIDGIRTSLRKR